MILLKFIFGSKPGPQFHIEYTQRPALGVGNSPQYVYESLALAPRTPIGAGTDVHGNLSFLQMPQAMHTQKVLISGMPEVAGQIAAPSLYVPK